MRAIGALRETEAVAADTARAEELLNTRAKKAATPDPLAT